MAEKRGSRFEELTIKINKKYYRLINAVCGGDPRKVNKLVRHLLTEALMNKSTDELLKIVETSSRKKKAEEKAE